MGMVFKVGRKKYPVSSLEQASLIWRSLFTELTFANPQRLQSLSNDQRTITQDGRLIGYVSQNGKVWGGVPSLSNNNLLFCPYEAEERRRMNDAT